MANRFAEREMPEGIINPRRQRYLHLVPVLDQQTGIVTYEYIISLMGMSLEFGKFKDDVFSAISDLNIGLLPPLDKIPPRSYRGERLVRRRMRKCEGQILERITPQVSAIALTHGSSWGLFPELELARRLRLKGFEVENYFPQIGGRKRIQTHAVILAN